jgi:SPP1 family predicted phage head-tail adaptor
MDRKFNPGELSHRIDLWGKVEIENELGEKDFDYAKLKTVWASIVPQTGSLQKQVADTVLSNVTHKIIVRYTSDIVQDMHIMFRGQRFDINYILNPYFKNETLELFVVQVIE